MARTKDATLPLYDATFTLYRASPLHLPRTPTQGPNPQAVTTQSQTAHVSSTPATTSSKSLLSSFRSSLSPHARRFTAHLQRDLGLGGGGGAPGLGLGPREPDEALVRAGQLQNVSWTWLSAGQAEEGGGEEAEVDTGADGFDLTEGLRVDVVFERARYTALLLRRAVADLRTAPQPPSTQLELPLCLLRMPAPLRSSLFSYLAAHFDARADAVRVPERALARALEAYLAVLAPRSATADSDSDLGAGPKITKDVQLTLALPDSSPSLRAVDVALKAADVARFVQTGAALRDAHDARPAAVRADGRPDRRAAVGAGPFTAALAAYMHAHLALDVEHPAVRLARVACGGFALGREGRVKIFAPVGGEGEAVVQGIVDGLWELVRREGKEEEDGDDTLFVT